MNLLITSAVGTDLLNDDYSLVLALDTGHIEVANCLWMSGCYLFIPP